MDKKSIRIKGEKMRFKDYIFKHLKNQKQNLQDAVIDIPRQTYAVGVFSNPEDKDPKIKPEIIGMIMKQFTEFKKRISYIRLFINRFYLN